MLEVGRPPAGGEQQTVGTPAVAALERAQRGLEHAGVRGGRMALDVEEQQPVEARRDRVSLGVELERRAPRVLARRQAGGLRPQRHQRDRATGDRGLHVDPSDHAAHRDRGRADEESAAIQ